jgi:xylose dehydrogenase (NAD/NADP)
MNNDQTVQWGILGCARIAATALIPGIKSSANGEILTVASRSLEKAKEYARKFDIPRAYGSYEALLDDPEIQAVCVPLPNSLHKEWTIKAAQKGKHVLCEKPIACCAADAQEMNEACRENGVLLMEAFAQRFHPQYQRAQELIQKGRIGRILRITAAMSRSLYPADDIRMNLSLCGGALMDLGCYCINTARYLVGAEPVSVFATQEIGSSGVDERTTGTLCFPGGEILQFDTNLYMEDMHFEQGCTVYGEKRNIHIPQAFSQVEILRFGQMVEAALFTTNYRIGSHQTETVRIEAVHQWQLELEFFADRVLTQRPIELPGENGVANMRAIDAVVLSAQTGAPVELS